MEGGGDLDRLFFWIDFYSFFFSLIFILFSNFFGPFFPAFFFYTFLFVDGKGLRMYILEEMDGELRGGFATEFFFILFRFFFFSPSILCIQGWGDYLGGE